MKLIHCADLHLDARMESGLPKEKARERRLELLRTFTRLVERAEEEAVDALLLCGDIFDARTISARARNCVLDAVTQHPHLVFYYLQGNHDRNSFLSELSALPENLKVFGPDWTRYEQGDVTITGAELSEQTKEGLFDRLILDADRINIVMLHGTAQEYGDGASKDGFSLRSLRGRNIDYLALGHIHSFREGALDERGRWCYSGCLEGRGFDECGEKGYVLLEVEGRSVHSTFVPFAERTLHEIAVDVSGLCTQEEQRRAVEARIAAVPQKDLIKLRLVGEIPPEAERDASWIERWLSPGFYFLKVKDETRIAVRPEDYRYDVSLSGEFVRQVLASGLPEEEKEQVLRIGIRALRGED